jgi:hypothetical protein
LFYRRSDGRHYYASSNLKHIASNPTRKHNKEEKLHILAFCTLFFLSLSDIKLCRSVHPITTPPTLFLFSRHQISSWNKFSWWSCPFNHFRQGRPRVAQSKHVVPWSSPLSAPRDFSFANIQGAKTNLI